MQEIALFSREIYTPETNFTRPPVVTVATNLNSEDQVRKFLAPVSRGCYINWSVDLSFDIEYDACQTESYEIEST